jgi:putative secretion ATPase (PEP-CTERM system associated)
MYTDFYGLSCKPFQLNPDHSFYYNSGQHQRAKAYLEYGAQRNEGFIVITGEVGAGKTTIVRGLLASLDSRKVVAANLVTTQLGAEDTLRMVGSAFGVPVKGLSKADMLMELEAFMLQQISQGKRCLLVVDEAQNLTKHAVEELRMLSNFQLNQQALMQTFLVGQPEFRSILLSPGMQQLRQRVTATCHIGPMNREETRGYIMHRLKCAGAGEKPTFDDDAIAGIHKASGGIPRRINVICDRLLLLGFLQEVIHFTGVEVAAVVDEIAEESSTQKQVEGAGPARNDDEDLMPQDKVADWMSLDLSSLKLEPNLSKSLLDQIDLQQAGQLDARVRRLEESMLRIEKGNMEIIKLMQAMVVNLQTAKTPRPTAKKEKS